MNVDSTSPFLLFLYLDSLPMPLLSLPVPHSVSHKSMKWPLISANYGEVGAGGNSGVVWGQFRQRSTETLRLRLVSVGVAGGGYSSPFWWWLADRVLLSGTQGSHERLCKQPKRKGTFPLAESAVKRFPATVIAAFGGIISVVLWAEEGRMWDGKERHRRWVLCLMTKWEPGAKGEVPVHYDWSFDQHPGIPDAHHMDRPLSEGSQWQDFCLLCVAFVPITWIPPYMVFTATAACRAPEICTW